jgi:hypothetical protein
LMALIVVPAGAVSLPRPPSSLLHAGRFRSRTKPGQDQFTQCRAAAFSH